MHSAVSNGTELYVDAAPTDWGCTVRTASSTSAQGSITQAVSCSGNEKVISGGCYDYNKDATFFLADYPTDQEWYCVSYYSGSHTITANANCCT